MKTIILLVAAFSFYLSASCQLTVPELMTLAETPMDEVEDYLLKKKFEFYSNDENDSCSTITYLSDSPKRFVYINNCLDVKHMISYETPNQTEYTSARSLVKKEGYELVRTDSTTEGILAYYYKKGNWIVVLQTLKDKEYNDGKAFYLISAVKQS